MPLAESNHVSNAVRPCASIGRVFFPAFGSNAILASGSLLASEIGVGGALFWVSDPMSLGRRSYEGLSVRLGRFKPRSTTKGPPVGPRDGAGVSR